MTSTITADVEGWDSVNDIDLMVALEHEFGVWLSTGEMADVPDARRLVVLIGTRRSRTAEGS